MTAIKNKEKNYTPPVKEVKLINDNRLSVTANKIENFAKVSSDVIENIKRIKSDVLFDKFQKDIIEKHASLDTTNDEVTINSQPDPETFTVEEVSEPFFYNNRVGFELFLNVFSFSKKLSGDSLKTISDNIFVRQDGSYPQNGVVKYAFKSVTRHFDYNKFDIMFYDVYLQHFELLKAPSYKSIKPKNITVLNETRSNQLRSSYSNESKSFISHKYTTIEKPYMKLIYKIDEILRSNIEKAKDSASSLFGNDDICRFILGYGQYIKLYRYNKKYSPTSKSVYIPTYVTDNNIVNEVPAPEEYSTYVKDFNDGICSLDGKLFVDQTLLDNISIDKISCYDPEHYEKAKAILKKYLSPLSTINIRMINSNEEQEKYYSDLITQFNYAVDEVTSYATESDLNTLFILYFIMLSSDHYYRWIFDVEESDVYEKIIELINKYDYRVKSIIDTINNGITGPYTESQINSIISSIDGAVVTSVSNLGDKIRIKMYIDDVSDSLMFYIAYRNSKYEHCIEPSASYFTSKLSPHNINVTAVNTYNNEYTLEFEYKTKPGKITVLFENNSFSLLGSNKESYAFVSSAKIPNKTLYADVRDPNIDKQEVSFIRLIRLLNILYLNFVNFKNNSQSVMRSINDKVQDIIYSREEDKVASVQTHLFNNKIYIKDIAIKDSIYTLSRLEQDIFAKTSNAITNKFLK